MLASRFSVATRSVTEPSGTGTRIARPSNLPFRWGSTRPVAFAAPVDVGMMLIAAARARRRSLCGRSRIDWSFVYAWIVVMKAISRPKASSSTFAIGATQLVVHDAFEITLCWEGSYRSSFTPSTTVRSSPFAGALMTTFSAPASMCLSAFSRSVNNPVDSTTTCAPSSFHGSSAGSRTARTRSSSPSTVMPPSYVPTSPSNRPSTESYFSRCASVAASVTSFTATKSQSISSCLAARKKFLPILPKPLMPTFTPMVPPPEVGSPS